MTTPTNTPPAATAKDAASARKRRRRAPAGGAADDCFTCAKRNVKCDRRRPYCSQCLEIGNECSGYKTQLTWGVGVASRGKLRGLSLPIAKSPPVNPGKGVTALKSPTTRQRASSIASVSQYSETEDRVKREGTEQPSMDLHSPLHSPLSGPPFHHFDISHMSPVTEAPPPGWTHIPFTSPMSPHDGPGYPGRSMSLSMASHMDSISEADYMSPIAHSFPRDDISYIHSPLHSPTVMYDSYPGHGSPVQHTPPSAIMIEPHRPPTSCPSLGYSPSEPASSLPSRVSHVDNLEAQLSRKMAQECDVFGPGKPSDIEVFSTSVQSHGPFWAPSSADDESLSQSVQDHTQLLWPASFPSQSPSPILRVSPDLIHKMPFFMDYYEKTICPGMVFIDNPSNPFREHILQLGTTSRSLQHAICALAACNLRIKRRLSLGQHRRDVGEKRLDSSPFDGYPDTQPEDQSLSEEYQHRNLAVHLLNEQLNDPEKSTHDSVLATILILCHYRMAESGVAKFQTQFAGVKKILGLRRMSPYPASRDSAWMEAIFTYFDAITASVNDREAQLNTSFYGPLPDSQLLPPGTENLVGCDRELFRTIVKLGRLNLLSQHRPVHNLLANAQRARGSSISGTPSPLGGGFKQSLPEHHHMFGSFQPMRFEGSGFGSTMEDDEMMGMGHTSMGYDDHGSTFWREWKDARTALQSWEFDASRVVASLAPTPSSPPPTGSQVRDLSSLSEAFRYAALLYTERLASPHLPSSHSHFRDLVSQVVYYATSLEAGSGAEKFLLWPLFVAGSECVNVLQQNIVRSKCRDIMARSGYMNNMAALNVLERLWAENVKEDGPGAKMRGMMRSGPFNWSRCIGGPGVDVEWIMF
ncbi:fungal-specific transcription factor domain-containing protein [Pseudoneurospora amorphoporcata]|uniref:Fungal-specific transcription factor domain-containing protein n=1 Tax=Pseudoneurospora amorphoporcata TaxID=241081 RepID=A0AAN6NSY3_9PEZI|nr:fungal-specific transcription factor domain-containing protein [Pseudoneurospora amorphoporcata]